jgi:hypothetical protein
VVLVGHREGRYVDLAIPHRFGKRLAWLLRAGRVHSGVESAASLVHFAAAFRGGSWQRHVDRGTISRWETAKRPPPAAALRRYEEVLGLPPGRIEALAAIVGRYHAIPETRLPAADEPPGRRTRDLLDAAATDDEPLTGEQWLELTAGLCGSRRVVVAPLAAREHLVHRLAVETLTSDGLEWMRRFEAASRMMGHAQWQAGTVNVYACLGQDGVNPVSVEAVSMMDMTSHPDAAGHVLAQLTRPSSGGALYGALLSCHRKIAFNHFTPAQLDVVALRLADVLDDQARGDDAGALAVELLRRLPQRHRRRTEGRLAHAVRANGVLHPVLRHGRTVPPVVAERVVARLHELLPAHPEEDDGVLVGLVDDVLASPVFDARLYAGMLIAATPYRTPFAGAVAELLGDGRRSPAHLTVAVLNALRTTGGPEHRRVIERLALSRGLPRQVTAAASHALGHVAGASDRAYWRTALRHHTVNGRGDDATTALARVVYAVGIARDLDFLRELHADPAAPEVVRASAGWWLRR